MLAERLPLRKGVKVTVIEQLAPAAILLPQLLASVKSLGSVPVTEIFVMLTATPPLLVRLIFFGWLLVSIG